MVENRITFLVRRGFRVSMKMRSICSIGSISAASAAAVQSCFGSPHVCARSFPTHSHSVACIDTYRRAVFAPRLAQIVCSVCCSAGLCLLASDRGKTLAFRERNWRWMRIRRCRCRPRRTLDRVMSRHCVIEWIVRAAASPALNRAHELAIRSARPAAAPSSSPLR